MNLRKIVVMLLFIVGAGVACAEDGLTVKDVAIPKDGKAMLAIETAFESDAYFGYQFEVQFDKRVDHLSVCRIEDGQSAYPCRQLCVGGRAS